MFLGWCAANSRIQIMKCSHFAAGCSDYSGQQKRNAQVPEEIQLPDSQCSRESGGFVRAIEKIAERSNWPTGPGFGNVPGSSSFKLVVATSEILLHRLINVGWPFSSSMCFCMRLPL